MKKLVLCALLPIFAISSSLSAAPQQQAAPKAAEESSSTASTLAKASIGLIILAGIGVLVGFSIHNFKSGSATAH